MLDLNLKRERTDHLVRPLPFALLGEVRSGRRPGRTPPPPSRRSGRPAASCHRSCKGQQEANDFFHDRSSFLTTLFLLSKK